MTRVDALHIDGCPHTDPTADRVREVASRLGLEIDLRLVAIETMEDAERIRFVGSPTVLLNDVDIDPSGRRDFALCCRVYNGSGVPPESMIATALAKHA